MTSSIGLLIFAGISAIILIIASAISEVLVRRNGLNDKLNRLNDRIASWWVILTIFLLFILIGKYGVVVLFAICSFAAMREFLTLIEFERGDHWSLLAIIFAVLPIQFTLFAIDWVGMAFIFIPVYGFLLLPVSSAFRGTSEGFLPRIAQYQWALMLCVYCMSHLPAILFLHIDGDKILLLVYLVFIVEIAKAAQHIIGKMISARKLAPHLSKSRNVAGFWGGILVASLAASLLHFMTPFGLLPAFAIGFATTLTGLCGSIVMTAIKRDRGVRDFGYAVSGHGGFLDGMDAILYAAPIFYHLTRFFWG